MQGKQALLSGIAGTTYYYTQGFGSVLVLNAGFYTKYEFEHWERRPYRVANRRALQRVLLAQPRLSSDLHEYSPPGTRSVFVASGVCLGGSS